jgi:hypothetical protein
LKPAFESLEEQAILLDEVCIKIAMESNPSGANSANMWGLLLNKERKK